MQRSRQRNAQSNGSAVDKALGDFCDTILQITIEIPIATLTMTWKVKGRRREAFSNAIAIGAMARADDRVQCIIKARSFPSPKTM